MEQYEAYKDSGIEWIGEIPKEWDTIRLGEISYIRARLGWRALKADEYVDDGYPMYSAFNIVNESFVTEPVNYITEFRYMESPEIMMAVGDIMLVKDGAGVGKCAVIRNLDGPCTVNGSIALITPNESQDSRYLYYFFESNAFQHFSRMLMGGMGVPHLFQRDIKLMQVIQPDLNTQTTIADYLDAKTAEIDALVADCEREVGLLREYRKAVISEAVTKGLDPDVPMKDSGIEWIDKIPETWLISRLASCIESIKSGVSVNGASYAAGAGEVGVLKTSSVYHDIFTATENKQVNPDEITRVKCPVLANRLVVSRMNTPEWVGACGYVDKNHPNLFLPDRLWQIEIGEKAICKYVYYWLQCRGVKSWISVIAVGTSGSMKNISQSEFDRLPITMPPLTEQSDIIDYLDAKTAEIDSLIEAKQQMVDKLREYRKSLISEAVTGKFKVPGV